MWLSYSSLYSSVMNTDNSRRVMLGEGDGCRVTDRSVICVETKSVSIEWGGGVNLLCNGEEEKLLND